MNKLITKLAATVVLTASMSSVNAELPDPGMEIVPGRTALLITDPQNDFLSPKGVTWGVVGRSVTENNTVENIETLVKIEKVILGGMSANLCTESHMRELMEQGFEVAVVSDATAAAQLPEGDGYEATLVNFRFIANTVWDAKEASHVITHSH